MKGGCAKVGKWKVEGRRWKVGGGKLKVEGAGRAEGPMVSDLPARRSGPTSRRPFLVLENLVHGTSGSAGLGLHEDRKDREAVAVVVRLDSKTASFVEVRIWSEVGSRPPGGPVAR